jgi:N-acetylglucosamine malate deacetylase 2
MRGAPGSRRAETEALLAKAGVPRERYHCLEIADQEVPLHLRHVRSYVEAFGAGRVYTHAYEGGHPDHDAMALALSGLPGVWEFPLYHGYGAEFTAHAFLDGEPETAVVFSASDQVLKREWLDCFASQRRVTGRFPVERELFRPMRDYDFSHPPHPGELYYERRKLGWTWAEWQKATSKGLD